MTTPYSQLAHAKPYRSPINVTGTEKKLSLAGGGVLLLNGLRRGGLGGLLQVALGGALLWRGASGHCQVKQALTPSAFEDQLQHDYGWKSAEAVSRTITVLRPRAEVFEFCRNPQNLPLFMRRLERIELLDGIATRWTANGPLGRTLSWIARVEEERENELVVWSCGSKDAFQHAGLFQHKISARFSDALDGRGTLIEVVLACEPPAGRLGYAVAKLVSTFASTELGGDLRRLKQLLEAGEAANDYLTLDHVESPEHGNAVDRGTLVSRAGLS
jgi:uncharacterized membrane protein